MHSNELDWLNELDAGLDYGCGPGPTLSVMLEEAGHTVNLYDPFFAPFAGALSHQYDFITCTEAIEPGDYRQQRHPCSEEAACRTVGAGAICCAPVTGARCSARGVEIEIVIGSAGVIHDTGEPPGTAGVTDVRPPDGRPIVYTQQDPGAEYNDPASLMVFNLDTGSVTEIDRGTGINAID